MRKIVFLVAASVFVSAGALAQRVSKVDGTKLLAMCTNPKDKVECEAYLSGVGDAIGAGGKATAEACIPVSVTTVQLHDVVVKFLKDHPGDRELKAGTLTLRAYAAAFSCRK